MGRRRRHLSGEGTGQGTSSPDVFGNSPIYGSPNYIGIEADNTPGAPFYGTPQHLQYASQGMSRVPGQGAGDTVPAMLTPGEAVLTRGASELLGRDTVDRLNALAEVMKGGDGGPSAPNHYQMGTSNAGGLDDRTRQIVHGVAMQYGGRPPQGFQDGTADVQPPPDAGPSQMDPRIKQIVHQVAMQHGGRPPDAMAGVFGGQGGGAPPTPPQGPPQGAPPPPQMAPPPQRPGLGARLGSELGIGSAQARDFNAGGQMTSQGAARRETQQERLRGAERLQEERGDQAAHIQSERDKAAMEREQYKYQHQPEDSETARARSTATIYNNYGTDVGLLAERRDMLKDAIAAEKNSDKKKTLFDEYDATTRKIENLVRGIKEPGPKPEGPSMLNPLNWFGGGGASQQSAQAAAPQQRQAPPPQALEFLKAHPETRAQFEQKYGPIQ